MLGTKIQKPLDTQGKCDNYAELANWCNNNDAHIEDKGEYYEIIANTHPEPTAEEKANNIRSERDTKLNETQWMVDRHHEETELVTAKSTQATTLTDTEYQELLDYRQALRDVPQQSTFPDSVVWPEEPSFMRPKEIVEAETTPATV